VDEELNEQDQELNVPVHHKEVNEESEATVSVPETTDSGPTEPPKTFGPQPIGPEFTPAPTKKRKIKKWMIIVPILLVLIIGAGAGAFYLANNKKTTSKNTKTPVISKTSTKTPVSSIKPADVVSKIRDYITTKYPQVMPEGTKLAAEQIYFKTSDNAPAWKISGEKLLYISYFGEDALNLDVYYNSTSGGDDAGSARYVGISTAIIQSLADQGFTKSTDSVYSSKSGHVAYTKDDVVCTTGSPDNGSISPPASIACGQISKYTKSLSGYTQIEPYASALAKTGKMTVGAVLTFSALKAGMDGYENAEVGLGNAGAEVGGAMGLFYKAPTGDWQFFTGTQAEIDCSAYNTKDLQYAFAYDNCNDSSKTGDATNSTVASFYNLQP
jgi:hypothetical protein